MFGRLLIHSLAARRARVALALVVVALGVGVATALATLALEVGDDLARTLRGAGPNFVVVHAGASLNLDLGGAGIEPARAGLGLPEASVASLKSGFWRNNVLEAAPELRIAVTLDGRPAALSGTWFERRVAIPDGEWSTGLARLRPHWRVDGRWPREDADEIALGRELASRLGLSPGRTVEVEAGGRRVPLRVTGVVTAGGLEDRQGWAPLSRVQSIANRPGELDRVWLSALVIPPASKPVPDPARDPVGYERYRCSAYPEVVAADLREHQADVEVLPMTEVVEGEARVVGRLNLLMLLLALAALTASTLGLLSSTSATVAERSRELGLLRALGAGTRQLALLILGENALVALAGGALGWLSGGLGAAAIRGQAFGAGHSGLTVHPLLLPIALLIALALALLGTLGPLRLLSRLDPVTVLRG